MNILKFITSLFLPNEQEKRAHELYAAAVCQARMPFLYEKYSVPDTVDGRFDSITLHVVLMLHAMKDKEALRGLSRDLVGVFMTDLDRSFREMGVGDLSVGKKVKAAAKAFYGRLQAYDEAIENVSTLKEALGRNMFRGEPVEQDKLAGLVNYIHQIRSGYVELSEDDWNRGEIPSLEQENG